MVSPCWCSRWCVSSQSPSTDRLLYDIDSAMLCPVIAHSAAEVAFLLIPLPLRLRGAVTTAGATVIFSSSPQEASCVSSSDIATSSSDSASE